MNKYAWFALALLLVFVVVLFVTPLIRFQPWFAWWKRHQKPKEPVSCVSLALLAYQSSMSVLYDVAQLFVHENLQIGAPWQADFLQGILDRWAVEYTKPNLLTPYGCCVSVAPQPGNPSYKLKPNVEPSKGKGRYQGTPFIAWPYELLENPVYAQYSQRELWWGVFAAWGCFESPDKPGYLVAKGGCSDCDALWQDRSNFLYHGYRIPRESPLCAAFVIGTSADPGENVWLPDAMASLLGVNEVSGAGGWVGLLRAGGDWGGMGLLGMERIVWSVDAAALPPKDPPVKKCGAPGVAAAGVQGLNLGAMGAFTAMATPAGPFGAVIGGVLGLVAGGVLGLLQYHCIG